MRLNIDKCKVMHIGKRNRRKNYTIVDYVSKNVIELDSTDCERDLRVFIYSDLKPNKQVNKAASKANSLLGLLKRRPQVEFAISAWSPYTKKDIKTLEKVQERQTKTICSIRHLPYSERCPS